MTPTDVLRAAWLGCACVGAAGLCWNLWVWQRIRRNMRGTTDPTLCYGLSVRRRDITYRIALKACLCSYALMRWEILSLGVPAFLVWQQAVDVGLFAAALVLLTVWSAHTWLATRRHWGNTG